MIPVQTIAFQNTRLLSSLYRPLMSEKHFKLEPLRTVPPARRFRNTVVKQMNAGEREDFYNRRICLSVRGEIK